MHVENLAPSFYGERARVGIIYRFARFYGATALYIPATRINIVGEINWFLYIAARLIRLNSGAEAISGGAAAVSFYKLSGFAKLCE